MLSRRALLTRLLPAKDAPSAEPAPQPLDTARNSAKGLSRRAFLAITGGGTAALAAGVPLTSPSLGGATKASLIDGLSTFFDADITSLAVARGNMVAHLCGPSGRCAASSLRAAIDLVQTQALTAPGLMRAALASSQALSSPEFGKAIVADRGIFAALSQAWSEQAEFSRFLGLAPSQGGAALQSFAELAPAQQAQFALDVFRSASTSVCLSRTSEIQIARVLSRGRSSTVRALLQRAAELPESQLLAFADGPEMRAAHRLANALDRLGTVSPDTPDYRTAHEEAQRAAHDLEESGIPLDRRIKKDFALTSQRSQMVLRPLDPIDYLHLITRDMPVELFHGERQTWVREQGLDRDLSDRFHLFLKRCSLSNRYFYFDAGMSAEEIKQRLLGF